jgi:septum formation protein
MTRDFIYLASASPRRSELLRQIGVPFEVRPAEIEERPLPNERPADYVLRVAAAKADVVWASPAVRERPRPVLAADTAVVVDERVLGKPADGPAALAMLEVLSGRSHTVLTGVALRAERAREQLLCASEVRFRATTAAERAAYCATGEPLGKAGAYGIQGFGAIFIERLHGSYSAVMGLPLFETAALLARFGLPDWLALDRAGA